MRKLFALEVPEIASGAVEIAAIAREACYWTKIAVIAREARREREGLGIGPMGSRVRNVMAELHGEEDLIVDFSEDPAEFVAHALSLACLEVRVLDAANRVAQVIVPDYQLSLAIGKEGQNVRLAARLTNWRIDIQPDNQPGPGNDAGGSGGSGGSGGPGRTRPAARPARSRGPAAGPARRAGSPATPRGDAGTPGRPVNCGQPEGAGCRRRRPPCNEVQAAMRSTLSSMPGSVIRTCVGCGIRAAKSDLLRVVAVDGEIVADPAARRPGRGAYLHPSPDCWSEPGAAGRFRERCATGPLADGGLVRYLAGT